MDIKIKDISHSMRSKWIKLISAALLWLVSVTSAFAAIVLHGNQVISAPTTYNGVDLDLTDGRFTINTGGTLNIQNSTIAITISAANPFLAQLNNGAFNLKNSTVNVKVSGISQNPDIKALYQLIRVQQGNLNLSDNHFVIDTPFTVGLLDTQGVATSGFKIIHNTVDYFHGGLYLLNSNSAEVVDNMFSFVSFYNIYNLGNLSQIKNNIFSFPGNLKLGNAIDVVNSDSLTISNNIITSGSNYGLSITGGQNLFIENNKITDNKSYGIIIRTPALTEISKDAYLSTLIPVKAIKLISNNNILISNNYIAQNKYGLKGGVIDRLIVTNNIFIQRFNATSIRQYWTNNDNLLPAVNNLTWIDNFYKEAFTQEIDGNNAPSLQFVTFPAHGGVYIN